MIARTRRALLQAGLYGAVGCALPRFAGAQQRRAELDRTRLGPDTVVVTGAGTNVVAAADSQGFVMVDGGLAAHAASVLETLAETFDGRPLRTLFNTHWHPEQTGANRSAAQAGATIVSQVNTQLWLGTDIRRPWEEQVHAPLPPEARPRQTFYDAGNEVELGGTPLEYGHLLQAHTDGDCYVYFPEADVLACGGLIAGDRWPLVDWWTGGWLGGIVEGLETLLQIAGPETRVVPSEGPVLSRADLESQRDMYAELFVRFRDELLFEGLGPDEAVAARPTAEFHPDWPNRDTFVRLAFQSLWSFYAPDV